MEAAYLFRILILYTLVIVRGTVMLGKLTGILSFGSPVRMRLPFSHLIGLVVRAAMIDYSIEIPWQ
jgi:hypothetical protein